MRWDKSLETGHPKIDRQHQGLVEAFNRLDDAAMGNEPQEEQRRLLTLLLDATAAHFRWEAELMQESGYPGTPTHLKIHEDLFTDITELRQRFERSSTGISRRFLDFLREWLTNHFSGEDYRLASYLLRR